MRTKVAIAILAAALLAGGIYWFAMRNWRFREANWQALGDVFEASLGAASTVGAPHQGVADGQGAASYYQQHPDELERDKRCGQTIRAALEIAISARDSQQSVVRTASTNIEWVSPSDRMDGWGHAFCVRSGPQRTVVVSPGWRETGSFDCSTLNLTEEDLAKMVPRRLNVQASGALVFFLPPKGQDGG